MTDTSYVDTHKRLMELTLVETAKLIVFIESLGGYFGFFTYELEEHSNITFKRSFGKEESENEEGFLTYPALFSFLEELNLFLDEPITIERIDFLERLAVEIMLLLKTGDAKRISQVPDKEISNSKRAYESDLPAQSLIVDFQFGFIVHEEEAA